MNTKEEKLYFQITSFQSSFLLKSYFLLFYQKGSTIIIWCSMGMRKINWWLLCCKVQVYRKIWFDIWEKNILKRSFVVQVGITLNLLTVYYQLWREINLCFWNSWPIWLKAMKIKLWMRCMSFFMRLGIVFIWLTEVRFLLLSCSQEFYR